MPHPTSLPKAAPSYRWRVLAAGVIANAAFSMAFSGLPITAVVMRSACQLDNLTLGLMLGLMGLGIALSELPWGLLTDRWGDRPVLLLGLTTLALTLCAMTVFAAPASRSQAAWPWLGGGLLLVGLLGGSVNGSSGRAIMSWFAADERGLAMSIRQTAVPLGGGIGALVLPLLALQGFVWIYALLALLCALAAGLCAWWVREPDHSPAGAAAAGKDRVGPLQDPQIWRLVLGMGLLCAPQFAVVSFGSVFLHDYAGIGVHLAGTALAVVQGGAMGLRVWSGRWTDRRQNRPTYLYLCVLLSSVAFILLAGLALLAPGQADWARGTLCGVLIFAGLCVSAWHGVAYAELGSRAGARKSGTALGMANTSVFLACFLTPLLIPHLLAWQGWPVVWLVAAAAAAAAWPLLSAARKAA